MVTTPLERNDRPAHSLDRIKELAAEEAVIYAGRDVQRDADGLGYSFEDVCRCITELEQRDFSQSIRYTPHGEWHDVYLMSYEHPKRCIRDLYLKLRLTRDCLLVTVCSFHPEGSNE